MNQPGGLPDPYDVFMTPGSSIAAHITFLHTCLTEHMLSPWSEFHSSLARARRLLWSLPTVAPWAEFRVHYHDFMVTGAPGVHATRFLQLGPWNALVNDLLIRGDLEKKGITVETIQFVYPSLLAPPAPEPQPSPGTPSSVGATDDMGEEHMQGVSDGLDEVQEVIDVPDSPEVVVLSSDDEDGPDDGEEEDPEMDEEEIGELDPVMGGEPSGEVIDLSSDEGEDDPDDPDFDPTCGP